MTHHTVSPHWSEQELKRQFAHSHDVKILQHYFSETPDSALILIYSEGTCGRDAIGKTVMPALEQLYARAGQFQVFNNTLLSSLPLTAWEGEWTKEAIAEHIFEGMLVLVFPVIHSVFLMDIAKMPQRSPEESSTEISIKGPKDGFVENITTNIALIRKRIRSETLCCEIVTLGTRTKTKISLMYISDILSPSLLKTIRHRLDRIKVDGIYSIGQVEELISDRRHVLLPLTDFTGRPDYTVNALLNGRFVLIIDGSPMVLIGPATFGLQIKSPEDLQFQFQYVSFARSIRLICLLITLLLPGLWVSLVAFNQDQLPFRLLATITVARLGLPFPAQLELLIMLILLEIFREAGSRLPNAIGQTLTVVGGLIIGDASIRAGLVSPSSVVVGALTSVSAVTLVNQNLSVAVSLIRFGLFLFASFFGIYGLFVGAILLVGYMATLRSFGVPYLIPLSPIQFSSFPSLFRLPWSKLRRRPKYLNTIDSDHQEDDAT
ncbi:Spore germination protein XA [Paenibacillus plantiphilus]|uniref:Spore germination protein XA n=1 Tax=Paenibacillus plantiphilus TaxID=2905650 RepID=A0ABN8GE65_9BACL|nr:spore germination protein [Paenibacillus plantiphilus]CAH1203611.1 Spore germination protein XA [Paenibacillus plantiphilus]